MAISPRDFAELDRIARGDSFKDPAVVKDFHAQVEVTEDESGDWVVRYRDGDGDGYVTWFAGPKPEQRARDYFRALKTGAIKTIREGTVEH
jgi:hypothetical protein